jgi:TolB protein
MRPDVYRSDITTPNANPEMAPSGLGASDASASPDGSRIAFVAPDGGHTSVYVVNADGTGLAKIAGGPLSADQPAWGPDGTRLAFRLWSNYSSARIWVANADGSGARALTDDMPGEQQRPAWSASPNDGGPRIAFAQVVRGGDGFMRAQIWSMRGDGGDKRLVTSKTSDAFDDEPSWSPDGSQIVYVRAGPVNARQLFIVRVQDGSERPLFTSDPEGEQGAPAWAPDGALIAFVSSHDIDPAGYRKQIYTVRPDGTGLTRQTFDLTDKGNPAWINRAGSVATSSAAR